MGEGDAEQRQKLVEHGVRAGLGRACMFLDAVARGDDDAVRRLLPHLTVKSVYGPAEVLSAASRVIAGLAREEERKDG